MIAFQQVMDTNEPRILLSRRNLLMEYCEQHDWELVVRRLGDHHTSRREALEQSEDEGRTALHLACSNSADPCIVGLLFEANPGAMRMTDSIGMTPLHCACSTHYPSVAVVRQLLYLDQALGEDEDEDVTADSATNIMLLQLQDMDGDTPLHAACRAGASFDTIKVLVQAGPEVLLVKDGEVRTPLERLWKRFVEFQDENNERLSFYSHVSMRHWDDALKCVVFFLQTITKLLGWFEFEFEDHLHVDKGEQAECNLIHTAVFCPCPADILRIVLMLQPTRQLLRRDNFGQTALDVAISLPPKEHAHSPEFSTDSLEVIVQSFEGMFTPSLCSGKDKKDLTPIPSSSIIEILLAADYYDGRLYEACELDSGTAGMTPLHQALLFGKRWSEGAGALVQADPNSALKEDAMTGLQPFTLAALVCGGDNNKEVESSLTTVFELLRRAPEQLKPEWTSIINRENHTRLSTKKRPIMLEDSYIMCHATGTPRKRQRLAPPK
jgi:ankyrin repeat protein